MWSCQNCLREWPEPFCDECGRNLAHDLVNHVNDRGPRLTSEGERRGPQKETRIHGV